MNKSSYWLNWLQPTTKKGLAKVNIIKQIRRMSESEKTLWAKTLYTLHFFTLVVSLRIYGL